MRRLAEVRSATRNVHCDRRSFCSSVSLVFRPENATSGGRFKVLVAIEQHMARRLGPNALAASLLSEK